MVMFNFLNLRHWRRFRQLLTIFNFHLFNFPFRVRFLVLRMPLLQRRDFTPSASALALRRSRPFRLQLVRTLLGLPSTRLSSR